MAPIIAPSGTLVAATALREGLAAAGRSDVPVRTALPSGKVPRPAEFVVVSRIASPNPVFSTETVGLLVECYAGDEYDSEMLANTARYALEWAQGRPMAGHHIYRWHETSRPVNHPNPDTDKHVRHQFMGSLSISLAPSTSN